MKFAYNTLLYSAKEIGKAIDDSKEAGYHGIELNPVFWGVKGAAFAKNVKETKKLLKRAKLDVPCIMAGWLDKKTILEEVRAACLAARELNSKVIGVLPPRRKRMPWAMFVKILKNICGLAAKYNLKVAMHHHGGTMIERPDEVGLMIRSVPEAKVLFDIAHWWPFGNVIEGIKRFQKSIVYVHIKDIKPVKNYQYIIDELYHPPSNIDAMTSYGKCFIDMGKGVMDEKKILKEFKKFYKGWLTVEIENLRMDRFEHAKYNIDYLKKIGFYK